MVASFAIMLFYFTYWPNSAAFPVTALAPSLIGENTLSKI